MSGPRELVSPPPAARDRWGLPLVVAGWLALLTAVLLAPYVLHSPTQGDDLTRRTIRLALLFYGVAAALMLRLEPVDWRSVSARARLARCCWTLAWAAYLVHLAMAFHHYHHWSHGDAVRHTRELSGVGEGIYLSHAFTAVWTADVLWWWLRPRSYATRPAWIDGTLHGFMVFMIFNATVVYEEGFIRWAGAGLLTVLAGLWLWRRFCGSGFQS